MSVVIRLNDPLPDTSAIPYVIGVDEAGRGPAAGPVVAAAYCAGTGCMPEGVADSKALSEARRDALSAQLKRTGHFAFGISEAFEIDAINIREATKRAMQRAVLALLRLMGHQIDAGSALVLTDGDFVPPLACAARAIVRGDARLGVISAASILAKVERDRLMMLAGSRYPDFGFDRHKGYPSADHRRAIETHGPCPLHRRSFATVARTLTSE